MNTQRMSPGQVRTQAALAFRTRCRTAAPAEPLEATVLNGLAKFAPPALRNPRPGETGLSPQEVMHGIYHGLISEDHL